MEKVREYGWTWRYIMCRPKVKNDIFCAKKSFLKPINQPKDASDTVSKTTLHLASHLLRKKWPLNILGDFSAISSFLTIFKI